MIVVLVGYMGSGKSTIGKELASAFNYDFVDLDDAIETSEGKSIPDIFKTKGEIYFRKTEHNILLELLSSKDNIILALGGGTPCYWNNMDSINDHDNTRSIYLKTGIGSLCDRLLPEKENRPLISHLETKEALQEFIGKHLFERASFYSQSDITITTDNKTSKTIVEEIILQLI